MLLGIAATLAVTPDDTTPTWMGDCRTQGWLFFGLCWFVGSSVIYTLMRKANVSDYWDKREGYIYIGLAVLPFVMGGTRNLMLGNCPVARQEEYVFTQPEHERQFTSMFRHQHTDE